MAQRSLHSSGAEVMLRVPGMLIRGESPLSALQPTAGAGAGDAAVPGEAPVEPCVPPH